MQTLRSRFLLPGVLALLSTSLHAQEKHTLYYKNGQKALEGRWTYSASTFQKTNLTEAAVLAADRMGGEEDGPEVEHGDYSTTLYLALTQNIRCEGLVTAYYQNGSKRSEIHYKKGVANGPCTTYYKNGQKGWEGELEDGMMTGAWTGWYRDGQRYCKGVFRSLNQEQLESGWQEMLKSGSFSDAYRMRGDLLERRYSDTATYTSSLRNRFDAFQKGTAGVRSGTVVFFQKNGDSLASIALNNGMRDGLWKKWARGGSRPELILEYRDGALVAITEEGSPRQTTAQFVATANYRKEQRYEEQRRRYAQNRNDGGGGALSTEAPGYSYGGYNGGYASRRRNLKRAQSDNRDAIFRGPGSQQDWIKAHIQYPASALRDSTYGQVTVALMLSAEGKRTDAFIHKSSGHAGLDAEALRVVKLLPDFHPATSNGKKVRSVLSVPVQFDYPAVAEPVSSNGAGMADFDMVAREAPIPTVTEPSDPDKIVTDIDRPASFDGNLYEFINQNIQYPDSERKAGHQGKVFVQYIVNIDGTIQDVKVSRSSGFPALDAEAVRIIRASPRWKPAEKGGRKVRSVFKQPITFRLD